MKNRNLDHKDHWMTPPAFKNTYLSKHDWFDPCPYHADFDGLKIEWGQYNFINPPYSQKLKEAFVVKAINESKKGKVCLMLLPVSTSTKLFHEHIKPNATSIEFLKGRLPFIGVNDKGQLVNHHLIEDITDEKIHYLYTDKDGKQAVREIPLYIRNSGQHDSMVVVFGNLKI